MTEREQRMYYALKRISSYLLPDQLAKQSQKLYGLDGDEAISMAYENVIWEAKAAIKGMRRPRATGASIRQDSETAQKPNEQSPAEEA